MFDRIAFIMVVLLAGLPSTAYAAAGGRALMLKGGGFWIGDTTQEVARRHTVVDERSGIWGVAFENRRPGLTIGVEYLTYTHHWEATDPLSDRPDGRFYVRMVGPVFKKFFAPRAGVYYYLGGGISAAVIESRFFDYGSSYAGSAKRQDTVTPAVQGIAGAEWRAEGVALFAELKAIGAATPTEDDDVPRDNKYPNVSGGAVMMGVSALF